MDRQTHLDHIANSESVPLQERGKGEMSMLGLFGARLSRDLTRLLC